mmetsp:Transcript_89349/g.251585  ORF Transcript_89349/g.251585 Transcript_89349/m.251585 type:complete len:626 (+) Transcript_89349:69-1946(+)
MDGIAESLRRCAVVHGSACAAEVLRDWQEAVSEDLLGAAVFTLATGAVQGRTLEEQADAAEGLEKCFALASQSLDVEAVARLKRSVVERTLRRLDTAGDALAVKASEQLLRHDCGTTAEVTAPLRALFALLLRCNRSDGVSGRDLLDLVDGDAGLAMAVVAEGLGSPVPGGLPQWPSRLAKILHQLTTPDAFGWLLQRNAAVEDTNVTPIDELQQRRLHHCRALALCFVQFELLDRAMRAAEDKSHRELVMVSLMRAVHNIVGSRWHVEPGRLVSRAITLDFMRFGFRFVAPLMRKLVDNNTSSASVHLLRLTCTTLSWLLAHAEADGSGLLAESLRPMAAEWTLKALQHDVPSDGLAALITLAANAGCLTCDAQVLPVANSLRAAAAAELGHISARVEGDARRGGPLTADGRQGLAALDLTLPCGIVEEGGWPCDDGGDGGYDYEDADPQDDWLWEDDDSHLTATSPGVVQLSEPASCSECRMFSATGCYGEDYFESLWYCVRCWDAWNSASPGLCTLSSWMPLGHAETSLAEAEQQGAAALLIRAPWWMRCGVSGKLLTVSAVRIPVATNQPVAFERKSLERWHRRSGGRCPITGQPLDLKTLTDAPDILEAVQDWLVSMARA